MWKPPTSTGQAPERKLKTLVVLMAFVRDEEGELRPAFDLVNGEFGEPVLLFQHGDAPEME